MTLNPRGPRYVLDTSVALKWFVSSGEGDSIRAQGLREAHVGKRCRLSAPEFMLLELANALRTGRRFTSSEIIAILDALVALDLALEALQQSTLAKAVELATSFQTAVCDSYFLAMAMESGSMLVTADDRFARDVGKHPNLRTLGDLRLPEPA